MLAIGFDTHDHDRCIAHCVAKVDACCKSSGLRLTPVRRRVLELLLDRHRALGAYEILDTLRDEGLGSQPPVVYRALDFLIEHGFAHKIEQLNAYVACGQPGEHHIPAFLICRACSAVVETEPSREPLRRNARDAGFRIEKTVVEAEGICRTCQDLAE